MKHVSIFLFIIVTNKYFSSSSPSNVNVKIILWTIAKFVDKEGWMDEFQTLLLGLSQARAKLKLLIFHDEPNLNMHYLTKFGSFIAIRVPNLSICTKYPFGYSS